MRPLSFLQHLIHLFKLEKRNDDFSCCLEIQYHSSVVLVAKLCQLAQKVRKVSARVRASERSVSPLEPFDSYNLLPLVNSSDACTFMYAFIYRSAWKASCRVMVIGCNMLLDLDAALIIPTPSQRDFPSRILVRQLCTPFSCVLLAHSKALALYSSTARNWSGETASGAGTTDTHTRATRIMQFVQTHF